MDEFPKNRDGGWSGPGRKKAYDLGNAGDDAWLRARRFGATARNKGGHLVVLLDPLVKVIAPFLWTQSFGSFGVTYNSIGIAPRVTTKVTGNLRAPPLLTTGHDWYVGDGYVLQHSIHPTLQEPQVYQEPRARPSWLSIINVKDRTKEEVSSLSTDNLPGRSVSFFDEAPLPMRETFLNGLDHERPHPWVSGWNGQGYAFGFIGRKVLYERQPRQDRSEPEDPFTSTLDEQYTLRAWYGDTSTRRMQYTDLDPEKFRGSPFFTVGATAPGRLQGLFAHYSVLINASDVGGSPDSKFKYPSGYTMRMMRSTDHGRSWVAEEVPEIERMQMREAGVDLNGVPYNNFVNHLEGSYDFSFPELTRNMLGPLYEDGRAWGMFFKAKNVDELPVQAYRQPADWPNGYPWNNTYKLELYGRHGFFVSDPSGHNWTNKPWPGDNINSGSAALFYIEKYQPLNEWGVKALLTDMIEPNPNTAGQGTFFIPAVQYFRSELKEDQADAQVRSWIISTVDGGNSWRESNFLPDDLVVNGAVAKLVVARPYVNEANTGELYFISPRGNDVAVYRTTALFDVFTKVHVESIPGLSTPAYTGALSTVFIGDNSGTYPSRVRPGFPEFQKP